MQLSDDAVESLKILVEVCQILGVKLTLIGASSLIVYSQTNVLPIETLEATRDIDAVTSALNWGDYDRLIDQLLQKGFKKNSREAEHRLNYGEVTIDIIPYGKTLMEGNTIVWRETGNRMNARGLREAIIYAKPLEIKDGLKVQVPPPWMIVYLKVVAYLDEPQTRFKDIRDILTTLKYYEYDPEESKRFEIETDLTYELRGAFLIGLDMATNLGQTMLEPIVELLDKIEHDDSAIISRALVQKPIMQANEAFQLIDAMRQGLLSLD